MGQAARMDRDGLLRKECLGPSTFTPIPKSLREEWELTLPNEEAEQGTLQSGWGASVADYIRTSAVCAYSRCDVVFVLLRPLTFLSLRHPAVDRFCQ